MEVPDELTQGQFDKIEIPFENRPLIYSRRQIGKFELTLARGLAFGELGYGLKIDKLHTIFPKPDKLMEDYNGEPAFFHRPRWIILNGLYPLYFRPHRSYNGYYQAIAYDYEYSDAIAEVKTIDKKQRLTIDTEDWKYE